MSTLKKQMKDSYDRIASTFYQDSDNWEIRPDFQELLRVLEEYCPPEALMLDLGCGPGTPFLKRFAEHFRTVIGVDISPQMLDRARQHVPKARLIQADIGELSFPKSSFDAISCLYSLFHLPFDEQECLLAHISAWLKPGGFALLLFHAGDMERTDSLEDWHGAPMSWFLQPASWYERFLSDTGFQQRYEFIVEETPSWRWKIGLYQQGE